ncbi:MAG: Asp-tRNA(Asn)/Glu-tRNA(Gln) amidotransferase subunit GatC [Gammaproteobacteria bacterium]
MSLSEKEIDRVAWLARLQIDAEAKPQFAQQLSRILEFVDQLNKLDTSGVPPLAHPLDISERLRQDEVTETNQRDLFQSIAPSVRDGLYLVPKVIE